MLEWIYYVQSSDLVLHQDIKNNEYWCGQAQVASFNHHRQGEIN